MTDDAQPLTTLGHDYHDGDTEAGNELFEKSRPRLEALAAQMLRHHPRVRRWVDPDDLVQEVSLRLMSALREKTFTNTAGFYRLATTMIRYEICDRARSLYGPEGFAANTESVGGLTAADEILNGRCTDEELVDWARLHIVVESLPTEEREAFSLTYYHGWTQAEIADLFDIDDRTVRRWLDAAKATLRTRLGHDFVS